MGSTATIELPETTEHFIRFLLRSMEELGLILDLYQPSPPTKAVIVRRPKGVPLNYHGDPAAWGWRSTVDPVRSEVRIVEYTSGGRGMNWTARALALATTPEEIATIFTMAFLHDAVRHEWKEWRGAKFLLLNELRLMFAKEKGDDLIKYQHACRGVLPVSALRPENPPNHWYDVCRLIAVEAALNLGNFCLVCVDNGETKGSKLRLCTDVEGKIE